MYYDYSALRLSFRLKRFEADQFTHDLAVVEGDHRVGEFLIRLMPFASDQEAVSRLRHVQGQADGATSIVDPTDFLNCGYTLLHVGKNLRQWLAARVIRRRKSKVCELLHRFRHQRTLCPIAIPA